MKFTKVMFLQVCVCPQGGGMHVTWPTSFVGGHVLFLGGMCVFFWGCAWFFFWGACMGFFGGACMVFFGRACVVFWGACMVFFGGHAWFFFLGGMHGLYNEIRSMSGRYASYWNAFLLFNVYKMSWPHVHDILNRGLFQRQNLFNSSIQWFIQYFIVISQMHTAADSKILDMHPLSVPLSSFSCSFW